MTLLQVDAVQIMSIIECNTQMGQGDDKSDNVCMDVMIRITHRLLDKISIRIMDNVLDNIVVALPGVRGSLHLPHLQSYSQ